LMIVTAKNTGSAEIARIEARVAIEVLDLYLAWYLAYTGFIPYTVANGLCFRVLAPG
jgi:hypothetical protein